MNRNYLSENFLCKISNIKLPTTDVYTKIGRLFINNSQQPMSTDYSNNLQIISIQSIVFVSSKLRFSLNFN